MIRSNHREESLSPRELRRWSLDLDGDVSVRLTWIDGSTSETGFRLEQKIGAGAYAPIPASPVPPSLGAERTVIYTVTGLSGKETPYYFRVAADGPLGLTTYSNEVAATTGPRGPTGLSDTDGGPGVTLDWTDTSLFETGYVVQRSVDGGPFSIRAAGLSSSPWTDVSAPTGSLVYRVYATGIYGNSTPDTCTPVP